MIVLDCSVTMAWCFEDEASDECDAILDQIGDDGAIVPALWFWEVGNVLALAQRRGRISESATHQRLRLLSTLPIAIDNAGASTAWHETFSLAQAHRLTVYDAAYLELAVRVGAKLATKDKEMLAAAGQLGIETLL